VKFVKHNLKIQPEYFKEVCTGKKSFEIRINDRGYQVGDTLILCEFERNEYTGRVIERKITYITGYAHQEKLCVNGYRLRHYSIKALTKITTLRE
jgi:ASC-1-like (ASCH) protein